MMEFLEVFECLNMAPGQKNIPTLQTEGWIPDPVLMPTGRPNTVDDKGAIYHFVKGTDDEIREYVKRCSASTYQTPPDAKADEDVILGTQFVENSEAAQKPWADKGYFVAHKDHVTAKGVVMSLMGKRPKPAEKQEGPTKEEIFDAATTEFLRIRKEKEEAPKVDDAKPKV